MNKIWLFFIFCVLSCNNDKELVGPLIDADVNILYVNEKGDPYIHSGNISDYSDMKIFYLIDGVFREVNNPRKELHKGYKHIWDDELSGYKTLIFPSHHPDENNLSITHIQFPGTDIDTLQCQYNYGSENKRSLIITKLWYNNEVVWEAKPSHNSVS